MHQGQSNMTSEMSSLTVLHKKGIYKVQVTLQNMHVKQMLQLIQCYSTYYTFFFVNSASIQLDSGFEMMQSILELKCRLSALI